jgi:hypothetical protein
MTIEIEEKELRNKNEARTPKVKVSGTGVLRDKNGRIKGEIVFNSLAEEKDK